ncbi:MAG TPA: hypothetical protein VEI82_09115 [Myxococcota bacterium]|nr:hypothetical protein [Myxococcota bacterium]
MTPDQSAILEALGPGRRFADPSGPVEARRMAASGALPLPPPQLVPVLCALSLDPDASVAEKAKASLRALPDRVADAALSAKLDCHSLAVCAELFREQGPRVEKIALNPSTADATCCFLATLPNVRVVEILAQNQVRLLRCEALVEALGENPLTGMATIDRILHFLGVERGEHEEPEPERKGEDVPVPPPPDPSAESDALPVDLADASGIPSELTNEPDKELDDAEKEERSRNIMAAVTTMSVMEKMKLARFGNASARGVLVRDRNKLVAAAAIRNPKIADSEIEGYARSRQLSDEVIRIIANNRQWTRNYPVKLGLCMNPKCPPGTAIKFLNFLTDRDLGALMRSRDVPGPISLQARRILARKGKS